MMHIYKVLGIKKINTTAYHPQTDGLTERTNRTLLNILYNYIDQHKQDNWVDILPMARYVLNTHVNRTTGLSPFLAMFGRQPLLPLDASYYQSHLSSNAFPSETQLAYDLYNHIKELHQSAATALAAVVYKDLYPSRKVKQYDVGQAIWLRLHRIAKGLSFKLSFKWSGPYTIVGKPFPSVLTIMTRQGARNVNVSRCKPVYARVCNENPSFPLGQLLRYHSSLPLSNNNNNIDGSIPSLPLEPTLPSSV